MFLQWAPLGGTRDAPLGSPCSNHCWQLLLTAISGNVFAPFCSSSLNIAQFGTLLADDLSYKMGTDAITLAYRERKRVHRAASILGVFVAGRLGCLLLVETVLGAGANIPTVRHYSVVLSGNSF